jgi:hypothetical protein
MPSEKFFVHKEDGSLVRLKGRLVRFLDEEPPTGSDKSAIRTALEVSPDAEGLVQADVGTGPQNLVLHQHLGTMAYQDIAGVSMGTAEVDSLSVGNVGDGYSSVADELVVGDEDGSGGMTIVSNSGNSGSLFFADGTSSSSQRSAGKITYNHSADQLQIGTANTAAVTIDSSQRVGIQDAYPSAADSLTVSSDNASTSLPLSTMMVRNNSNTTGSCAGIAFQARNSAADVCGAFMGAVSQSTYRTADLAIHTRYNGTYGERLRITNSALVLGSGMAIDFGSGATTTLDTYEEGFHTATLTPASSGTMTLGTGADTLAYTRIGRTVTITGRLQLSSVSSPVGDYFKISLPTGIGVGNLTDAAGSLTGSCFVFNAAGNSGDYSVLGLEGDAFLRVYKNTNPSATATAADFSGDESIYLGVTYITA